MNLILIKIIAIIIIILFTFFLGFMCGKINNREITIDVTNWDEEEENEEK